MQRPQAKDYNETVNEVVAAWTEYAARELKAKLAKRGMVMTGELQSSIAWSITAANIEGQAAATLGVRNYGRFKDMKRLTYTRPANFDAMLGFVQKKGLAAFSYVPGYRNGRIPSTSVAMNRIAWGIAWSRLRKYQHRRKQWLNKFLYGPLVGRLVDDLIEKTGTSAVQIIEADIEAAFKNA